MDQWSGHTYYGRPQLKAAPFNKVMVGGYIFLAGLSGGAQLLSTLLDISGHRQAEPVVRRGRQLALIAPTIGSFLLVADLHTPKRFYNMLRVFKTTSPMSIGTWILTGFAGFSFVHAAADFVADRIPGFGWLRRGARLAQLPAAVTGAGLGTYTASLLSATSTPLWAAAPRALSVRFAASSVASAAAALSLLARDRETRRDLDMVCAGALGVEIAATVAADEEYRRRGIYDAMHSPGGRMDTLGAFDLGTVAPLGLLALNLVLGGRSRTLSAAASTAVLGGSLLMRIAVLAAGDESASRPEISMRFAQPQAQP
jgi:formate-dependent nitrite reductase membrane component NrfD